MKPIYLILIALMLCISVSSAAPITSGLNVTVTSSQVGPWLVGNSSYNQTLTLPDAGLANFPGKEFAFTVKVNPGTHWVRLVGTGGDTIGGAAIYATTDYPANVVIYSDGTNWLVKSYKGLWYKDGVAETLDWSSITTTQTFPTDLAMGTNDITGAGNVNATAVYCDGHLSMRPWIEVGKIAAKTKPEIVQVGAISGYKMILYAADEEIFFNEYIAGRWDGASNITCSLIGYLDTAETAGDDFAISLNWTNKATGSGVISTASNNVTVVTNCTTGRTAQYSIYKVEIPIDWDLPAADVTASDFFAGRIIRTPVGAGNTEIDGSFVITEIVLTYTVDKVFKA